MPAYEYECRTADCPRVGEVAPIQHRMALVGEPFPCGYCGQPRELLISLPADPRFDTHGGMRYHDAQGRVLPSAGGPKQKGIGSRATADPHGGFDLKETVRRAEVERRKTGRP